MIKTHGFWYITAGYKAFLVTAANREASAVKFTKLEPGVTPLYSAPGEICPECNRYKPPIDRDVQRLQFMDAQPCECGHQHRERYMPHAVEHIDNPLTTAQIN